MIETAMPDEILTLPEVAQLLKVAEQTVYSMAQKAVSRDGESK